MIYCLLIISIVVTIINIIKWVIFYIIKGYILSRYLKRKISKDFVSSISADMYFIISRVNNITASEIINELYISFKTSYQESEAYPLIV